MLFHNSVAEERDEDIILLQQCGVKTSGELHFTTTWLLNSIANLFGNNVVVKC